jgi:aspartate dehydrogenase
MTRSDAPPAAPVHPVRLALLGAGGIGRLVGDAMERGRLPGARVVAVAGAGAASRSAAELAARVGAPAVPPEALPDVGADWLLEAAGREAVRVHLPPVWRAGVSTVLMSIGALLDDDVAAAHRAALAAGVRVLLPSGGIAGLDAIRAMAASGGLRRVSITTTKPPAGLRGAPYLTRHGVELPDDRAITVFEGSAREAAAGFPANVNVAVALSLAGVGPDRTRVVIRSDPAAHLNEHRIEAEGDEAVLDLRIATRPSPSNPRTSSLAAASAVAALRDACGGG